MENIFNGQENGEYFLRQYKRNRQFRTLLKTKRAAMIDHIEALRAIADAVDKCHKGAAIANVTGKSMSAAGGITAIACLALAPATLGASLMVSGAVAVAGAAIKAAAEVSEAVSNKTDLKKVEEILKSCFNDFVEVSAAREACEDSIMTEEKQEDHERLLREIKSVWQEFFNDEVLGTSKMFTDNKDASIQDVVKFGIMLIPNFFDDIAEVILRFAAVAGAQVHVRKSVKTTEVTAGVNMSLDARDMYKNSVAIRRGAETTLASRIRKVADKIRSLVKVP